MDQHARESYWETQVLTASPQKLRLMLIEGAIRFSRQTVHYWEKEQFDDAFQSMMRCQNIIFELLTTLNKNGNELTKQISSLYLYLYTTLVNAQVKRDRGAVADVIRILEEERETWRQVCERYPQVTDADRAKMQEAAPEITAGDRPAIHSPHFNRVGETSGMNTSAMSFAVDA